MPYINSKDIFKARNSFLVLISFLFPSCGNQWNPDLQFEKELVQLNQQKENYLKSQLENSRKNLTELESNLLLELQSGIGIDRLNNLLGFQYNVIASQQAVDSSWEMR